MSLLAIEDLSHLNELLPETVARERDVLIVSNIDDQLTLTHPENGFGEEDRKAIEYILNRPILWVTSQLHEIRTAVPVAYGTVQDIDGCEWEFATKCPERWNNLEKTEQDTVRHCGTCNKLVHLCFAETEVRGHAEQGNCVCFISNEMHGESIGDVILQEFDETPIDFSDCIDTTDADTGDNAG